MASITRQGQNPPPPNTDTPPHHMTPESVHVMIDQALIRNSTNGDGTTVGQTQNVYAAGAYNQGGNSYQPQGEKQERNQFFQGASHGQNPSPTYQPPAYQALGYQAPVHQAFIPQPQVVTTTEFTNYMKANDAILKNMQTKMSSLTNSNLELKNMFGQFMKNNTASSSGLGTLPSNTITNSKEDLKGITTRSGNAYKGPTIPTTSSSPPKLVEPRTPLNEHCSTVLLKKLPEKLGDLEKYLIPCDFSRMDECLALADLGASINLIPLSVWNKLSHPKLSHTCMTLELADRSISRPVGVAKYDLVKIGTFHFSADFVVVEFDADPCVPLILGRSFLKTEHALIDVYEGELTLRVGKEAVTFNLDQTLRYSANYDAMSVNQIDLINVACEEYSPKVLGFSVSGNPTPSTKPIVSNSSPTLTPFGDSDFLLEETDAFLAIDDEPISPKIDEAYYDLEGYILLLEEFLNDDPSSPPLLPQELKEGDDKLPVIIAKDLKNEEKTALKKVLKSHKQALAWQLSNIKGINPEFYTYKILMEDDFKPAVQHQRRVNPKIHEVIKK
nr:reverse transcriptase domain-containing protein [Tanacetum cinerariifolium]